MTSTIHVHEANIRTASIEIRSLTVNNRQVTQSLFRQLPRAAIETRNGDLLGAPWGTVNYHTRSFECDEWTLDEHRHVVWQRNEELCHAIVSEPSPPGIVFETSIGMGRRYRTVRSTSEWLYAALREGWRPASSDWYDERYLGLDAERYLGPGRGGRSRYTTELFDSRRVFVEIDDLAFRFLIATASEDERELLKRRSNNYWSVLAAKADDVRAELDEQSTWFEEDARREIVHDLDEQDQLHARRLENWQSYCDLPQLFIAV